MGVTFRDGSYIRHVMFGGRTIKDGEAAAIWNSNGAHTEIIGPRRVILWDSTIRFLSRYKAESNQYLKIRHRDGTIEHKRGPISLYMNPSKHDKIETLNGIELKDQNHVILVAMIPFPENMSKNIMSVTAMEAQRDSGEKNIERNKTVVTTATTLDSPLTSTIHGNQQHLRIVRGPCLFVPSENELIHTMEWTDPHQSSYTQKDSINEYDNRNREVKEFSVVPLGISQVWNIRIPLKSANSIFTFFANFAITYELESIQKCISSNDPIRELENALFADVQKVAENNDDNEENNEEFADDNKNLSDDDQKTENIEAGEGKLEQEEGRHSPRRHRHRNHHGNDKDRSKKLGELLNNPTNFIQFHKVAESRGIKICMIQMLNLEIDKRILKKLEEKRNREYHIHLQDLKLQEEKKEIQVSFELTKRRAEIAEEEHLLALADVSRQTELDRKRRAEIREANKELDDSTIAFLKELHSLDVDVTKFICSAVVAASASGEKKRSNGEDQAGCMNNIPIIGRSPSIKYLFQDQERLNQQGNK